MRSQQQEWWRGGREAYLAIRDGDDRVVRANMSSLPDKSEQTHIFFNLDITQHVLSTHPNSFAVQPDIPLPAVSWPNLLAENPELPDSILPFLASARQLELPRSPIDIDVLPLPSEHGMSPKKAHEVARMSTYVLRLVRENNIPEQTLRIVDIGAGQGYLTRALKSHLKSAHILALDADKQQTRGAQKWEERLLPNASPPISHETILISPQNLLATIDLWVSEPAPVIFVALHACGSLTPDILRAFISASRSRRTWYPAGLVVVGCCYNLMNPVGPSVLSFPIFSPRFSHQKFRSDFPFSRKYLDLPTPLNLPVSAYHLAAQIPGQWIIPNSNPPIPHPSVALAIRKVAWRGLLEKALQNATWMPDTSSMEEENQNRNSATVPARWPRDKGEENSFDVKHQKSGIGMSRRLGKLRDAAYTNWNTFLHIAEQRMRVKFPSDEFDPDETESIAAGPKSRKTERETLERALEVLHVLRCLVGPVVESTILRDRMEWVRQELGTVLLPGPNSIEPRVELVNLFNQATGSGRNVAIVVAKSLPSTDDGVGTA